MRDWARLAFPELMDERATADSIAAYLFDTATRNMGLSARAELVARCMRIPPRPGRAILLMENILPLPPAA
jgi:hypothetical protein